MLKTEFIVPPRRSFLSTVLVLVIGASIVICGIALAFTVQRYRMYRLSRAIHHGKDRIVQLKTEEENAIALKGQVELITRRRVAVDSVSRYSLPLSSAIEQVVAAKPRAVELQFINLTPDKIELIGVVPVNRFVVDFVRQLKSSPLFSDAELIELKSIDTEPGLAFTIDAPLVNRPASRGRP